jgi:hypothetical protein
LFHLFELTPFSHHFLAVCFGIPLAHIEAVDSQLGLRSLMSDINNQQKCRIPGCGSPVPAELETETLCVTHFLTAAESSCSAIRREAIPGGPDAPRRLEIQDYVAASAMKLARLGTGAVRLSDDVKKRILTTFHTLMILRENLDRDADRVRPRRPVVKSDAPTELVAA